MSSTPTAETNAEGVPRESLEAAIAKTPFALLLGAKLTKYDVGAVELSVPVAEKLLQHHGFVHGAVIGFLADSACAWAAASVARDVVTSEYKVNLLAPAVGESLFARGEVIKASSRQIVCRADVYAVKDGTERIVATALATIARLR
jgi:uncharacterized protein (TIGR00369 family)